MSVRSVSAQDLPELLSGPAPVVVHFWATWAPQCAQMNDVMEELATEHPGLSFVKLEAEAAPDLALKHNVSAVPTFVLFKAGQPVERLDGAHAPELVKKVQQLAASGLHAAPAAASAAKTPSVDVKERLPALIRAAPCMLFMKGTPQEPRCGFSRQTVALLNQHGVKFGSFDILSDEAVRQGLKEFSNWPTYPQLYVKGELIGGLDIIKELAETGELDKMFKEGSLEDRLKSLIDKAPVMLFMKGNQETPRCGFSRSIVSILNDNGVKYETFDILQDEEVRQGLKTFSNWPTYPQLYARGELVGGLDIVKELLESGELLSTLQGQN